MPRRYEPEKKKSNNKIIIIAGVAAVVIVGGLVALSALAGSPPAPQNTSTARDWGSPNAPITLVEYSDLQ